MEKRNINLEELAVKIDNFYYDYDYYNYADAYDSREEGLKDVQDILANKTHSILVDELTDIIANEEGTEEDLQEAKELLELLQQLD